MTPIPASSVRLATSVAAFAVLMAAGAMAQQPAASTPAATASPAHHAGGDATAGAMMNLSKQLGGPGQRVLFTTEKHPVTGEQPEVRLAMDPNSGLESYIAKGAITLESPKLNLKCLEMDYRPAQSLIYANGDVAIEKDDLKANGDKLEFKIDTGEFVIEGTPLVEQQSDGNTLLFSGMEKFIVKNDDTGRRQISMEGGDKISVEIKLPDEPAAPSATPAAPKGVSALGNNVRIQAATAPEKPAAVQATLGTENAFESFAASGAVHLTTDDLELKGGQVNYNGPRQLMKAADDVWMKQADFEATAQAMEYMVDSGNFTLTGAPDVQQVSAKSTMRFTGMEKFIVKNDDTGRRRVELEDGDPIQVVMQSPQQTGTPNVTDGDTGMGALGNDVTISTSARRNAPARVVAAMATDGSFESFDASGAVHLKTPKLELRGDELIYDNPGNRMEASKHVWLKQANIEADAGRMNYDLKTGVIVLTEKPEVRQRTEEKQLRIWDIDIMTILDRGEGVMDVTYDSVTNGRPPQTEIISLAPGAPMPGATPGPTPTPAPAKVIDLNTTGPLPR